MTAWPPEKLRARRDRLKAARRCVDCTAGLQDEDGTLCVECAEARARWARSPRGRALRNVSHREYRNRNRDKRRAIAKARYRRHRLAGLCAKCTAPAIPSTAFCLKHEASHRASQLKRAERRTNPA